MKTYEEPRHINDELNMELHDIVRGASQAAGDVSDDIRELLRW